MSARALSRAAMDRLDGDDRHLVGESRFRSAEPGPRRQKPDRRSASARVCRIAATRSGSSGGIAAPLRHAATRSSSMRVATCCPASQRATGSVSWIARNLSRSSGTPLQFDRRREVAQQRRHRRRRHVGKAEYLALGCGHQHARAGPGCRSRRRAGSATRRRSARAAPSRAGSASAVSRAGPGSAARVAATVSS